MDDTAKLIIKFVDEFKAKNNGVSPSCRELADKVGINHVAISKRLKKMALNGLIMLQAGSRGIRKTADEVALSAKQLEIVALIKSGLSLTEMAKKLLIAVPSVHERIQTLERKGLLRRGVNAEGKTCFIFEEPVNA